MPDLTNPNTWSSPPWQWTASDVYSGRYGCAATGYLTPSGTVEWGGIWTGAPGAGWGVHGMWNEDPESNVYNIASGEPSEFGHFASDADHSEGWHYFVFERESTGSSYITRARPPDYFSTQTKAGGNPDVAAGDGWVYVVLDQPDGSIIIGQSDLNGFAYQWYDVTSDGSDPEVLIADDGTVECYYLRDGMVYKSISEDNGETWTEVGQVGTTSTIDDTIESPFQIIPEGFVFDTGDGDLYANIIITTTGAVINDLELVGAGIIATNITNAGTAYLMDSTWEIEIVGDGPLGTFFGLQQGTFLYNLFKGRILIGGYTSDTMWLAPGEIQDISSGSIFGIGHVMITVRVIDDGEVIAEKSEDGFLFGGRILLMYPEE